MAQSTIQKIKIDNDSFSFGLSPKYTANLCLIVTIIISIISIFVYQREVSPAIIGFVIAFAFFAGFIKFFIKSLSTDWIIYWKVSVDGIFIFNEKFNTEYFFKWEQISKISLINKYRSKGKDKQLLEKVALIQLTEEVHYESQYEQFVKSYLSASSKNTVLKRYCGESQDKVYELLLKFAPQETVIQKDDFFSPYL